MTINDTGAARPGQREFFARFWRAASGFWRGPSAWVGWTLAILLIVLIVAQLVVQYRLNFWNRDFFNALQQRNSATLWRQALLFLPLVAISTTLAILSVWGRMTAQRKWRSWLVRHLIDEWLADARYRRLHRVGGEHQNPEFRLSEDARIATDAPIDLAFGLLQALVTAATFISVLWTVGGSLAITAFGTTIAIPGYLVVAAIGYSIVFTSAMRAIGGNLTRVIERKNQAEAEFLSESTHLREVGENHVPLASEEDERSALATALGNVIAQWLDLCKQLMRTTLVSQGNFLLAPAVGWFLCAPKFLAGAMTLGELTQAAAAFVIVQSAFNWLVDNYPRLADWTSSVNRVAYFLISLDEVTNLDRREAAEAANRWRQEQARTSSTIPQAPLQDAAPAVPGSETAASS